jgi:zinc protease
MNRSSLFRSPLKFTLSALLCMSTAGSAMLAAPDVAVAKSKKKSAIDFELPVQTFQLENGLNVYVVEDHSTPAFTFQLFYDVGSVDEVEGKTGLAHFFEHMMFMGSEKLGKFMIGEYTEKAGGRINAGTSYDYTVYYHEIPSNYLEMILWGESDRLSNLIMEQEPFDVQRAAVISEKDRSENAPFSKAIQWEFLPDLMPESPYVHAVIGTQEDLENMTLEDATDFFSRYYSPNNAHMVFVGDVDFEEVKAKVDEYFGGIARGPERQPTPNVKPAAERPRKKVEKVVQDEKAQQTIYLVGWRSVDEAHEDRPALDLLANILFTGESARVPKVLTDEKQLTAGAGGTHFVFRNDGALFMQMVPAGGATSDQLKAALREEVDKVKKKGIASKELEKAIRMELMETVQTLSTNSGRASAVGMGAMFYGDPKRIISDMKRYESVTTKDIKRVANKYLDDNWVFYELGPASADGPTMMGPIR